MLEDWQTRPVHSQCSFVRPVVVAAEAAVAFRRKVDYLLWTGDDSVLAAVAEATFLTVAVGVGAAEPGAFL